MKAIADLWVPSSDVLFIDALGVFKSHEAISEMVEKIQGMSGESDKFVALGKLLMRKDTLNDDMNSSNL